MGDAQQPYMSPDEATAYQEQGCVVLDRQIAPELVEELRIETARLFADPILTDPNNLRAQSREAESGGRVVDRLDPIADISGPFRQLVDDPLILGIAAEALGDTPLLFKEKIIIKQPGTHGYGIHQDYTLWNELGAPPEAYVNIAVALDDTDAKNSATFFYPRLHQRHRGPSGEVKDVMDASAGLVPQEDLAGSEQVLGSMKAGSLLVFGSLIPHGSAPNTSGHPRRVTFLSYSAARFGDLRDTFYRQFHAYLRNDRRDHGGQSFFE